MRDITPKKTWRGLTFSQWAILRELAVTLCRVAAYLGDPLLISRADVLLGKISRRFVDG